MAKITKIVKLGVAGLLLGLMLSVVVVVFRDGVGFCYWIGDTWYCEDPPDPTCRTQSTYEVCDNPLANPPIWQNFGDVCNPSPGGGAWGTAYYNCQTRFAWTGFEGESTQIPYTCCMAHTYVCDGGCGSYSGGGGAPGAVCTGPNDCATGCCKGGVCKNDCVPPPARCNEGENFVPFGPTPQYSCQSPGACEMGSDGVTGGTAGEPLWDDPCGASGSGKYRCLLGSCVPVAPACKATPPRIVSITPENVTPTTQSSRLKWLIGRDGGSTHLIRVDESLTEVSTGCPTPGACEAATGVATYSQPADPEGRTSDKSRTIQPSNPQPPHRERLIEPLYLASEPAQRAGWDILRDVITDLRVAVKILRED